MKKIIQAVILTAVTTLVAMAFSLCMISCDDYLKVRDNGSQGLSTNEVMCCIDSVVNPEITAVEEALIFQNQMKERAKIDSIFMSLDPDVLQNVSSVILKRLRSTAKPDIVVSITKSDIVGEYLQNIEVYKNLPPNTSNVKISTEESATIKFAPIAPTTATEEQRTSVVSPPEKEEKVAHTESTHKDTIVNGKKTRITVTTTTYE